MRLWLLLVLLLSFHVSSNTLTNEMKRATPLSFDYSIQQTDSPQEISNWQPINSGRLNLGASSKPIWLKFTIENGTSELQEPLLFNAFVHIDKLTLFKAANDKLAQLSLLGDSVPIKSRYLKDADHIFKLSLVSNSRSTFYIKAETTGVLNLNFSLWQPDKYIEHKAKFNLVMGLILGIMLASALILSVLFFITKKQNFALAAVFNFCAWFLFAWLLGFVYRYITDQAVWFIHTLMPALCVFAFIPLNILTERILGLKSLSKPIVTSLRVLLGLSIALALLLLFVPYHYAFVTAIFFAVMHILVLLTATLIRAKNKETKARLLLACLLPMFVILLHKCALILAFDINLSKLSVLLGSCYLISCVALTLIAIGQYIQQRDIKVSQQQKQLAAAEANESLQSETIRLQEQHQEELESKIQERTFELEVTLRELQEKNRELEELNTQDALTGLRNRRHFDKKIKMEFRRSRREQTPLSVVMLDIDHFKIINDQYGHLTGDEAIKCVASIIKHALRRPSDIACRYGGEEFALILPNTDESGAKLVSENIRQQIEASTITTNDSNKIDLTISAGIFSAIADSAYDPNFYTDMADKALYLAKQRGRNRVCLADNNNPSNAEFQER